MRSFRLPLPPTTNHGYKLGVRYKQGQPRARMMKTPQLDSWIMQAGILLCGYSVPKRTPLSVGLAFYLPRKEYRRTDIDGRIKYVLDLVVGPRNDQYIDALWAEKHLTDGEGYVDVTLEALAG